MHSQPKPSFTKQKKKSFNGKERERERKAKKEDGIKEVKTAAKILSSSS